MTPVVRRVLLGVALSAVGNGLTMPLLLIYLGQVRGLGTAVGGLVVAYVAVISLLLLPLSGTAVDRFGPRPVLMFGLLAEGTGVALLSQVTTVSTAFAVGTVLAVGGSCVWGPQGALLGRLTDQTTRQRVFGIQFMLLNLGIGVGGLVAAAVVNISEVSTFVVLYLADAATFILYFVVLATLRGVGVGPAPGDEAEPEGPDASRAGYRQVVRDRILVRISIFALVLLTCGYGSVDIALPVFVTIINGLSLSWVAIAFTVNTVTIVALQLVSLRLMKNRSRSRLLALVAALWALSWLIIGSTQYVQPALAAALICGSTAVFALGETLLAPIGPAMINDLAPEHLRGRYNSTQGLVWGVSGALGPALAGLLLGAGLVSLWLAVVVGGCVVAGLLALRLRVHLTPALDGRVASDVEDGRMPA